MIRTRTTYICDVCGKEGNDRSFLHEVDILARRPSLAGLVGTSGTEGEVNYRNGRFEPRTVQLCKECMNRLGTLVARDFAKFEYDKFGNFCVSVPESAETPEDRE